MTTAAAPLTQRGYLWQRDWTRSVAAAFNEAESKMGGVILLGAEIHWNAGTPSVIVPKIPWGSLGKTQTSCSVALRVEPYWGPFSSKGIAIKTIVETAKLLIKTASDGGVKLKELQLDFDCAHDKLSGYKLWVEEVRRAIHPLPLVITTLPAWMKEFEFKPLVQAADGYVLQVHSVPTKKETGRNSLCDPSLARRWVAKASKIGTPFSVSLPTYHAIAGYDPSGKLLGVVMDSVQPPWPPDTRILDFTANADDVASLVEEWQTKRPSGMTELIWYRIPVVTDQENWRWPTLTAVMEGRKPKHQLETSSLGSNPVDISVVNTGEAEEPLDCKVTATWSGGQLVTSDALSSWRIKSTKEGAFFENVPGNRQRLLPGDKIDIGWLRFNKTPAINVHLQRNGT